MKIWPRNSPVEELSLVKVERTRDSIWRGKMVAAGVVAVAAMDSTQIAHVHVDIEVKRCPWRIDATIVRQRFARKTPDLTGRIGAPGAKAGLNVSATGSPYFDDILEGDSASPWQTAPSTATLGEVSGGPNDGYWYVTRQAYKVDRRYQLNIRLDPDSAPKELLDTLHNDTVNHCDYRKAADHHNVFGHIRSYVAAYDPPHVPTPTPFLFRDPAKPDTMAPQPKCDWSNF